MAWKTLKAWLRDEGIETASPKSALREAFKSGWLGPDPEPWHQMLSVAAHSATTQKTRALKGAGLRMSVSQPARRDSAASPAAVAR
jgi:hypothetical protein